MSKVTTAKRYFKDDLQNSHFPVLLCPQRFGKVKMEDFNTKVKFKLVTNTIKSATPKLMLW